MPYDWSALVFVEKWRTRATRGVLVAAQRLGDQTVFELRVHAPEWSSGAPATYVDLRLLDVGDLIREKRVALLDRVAAVVQPAAASVARTDRREKTFALQPVSRAPRTGGRRVLGEGSAITGELIESDGQRYLLVDAGIALVVSVREQAALADLKPGYFVELAFEGAVRGYVLAG